MLVRHKFGLSIKTISTFYILSAVFLLNIAISSQASGQNFRLSPKVGLILSNYEYLLTKSNYRPGFLFGTSATYVFTNVHAFQTELIYEEHGYLYVFDQIDGRVTYQYIQVPVAYSAGFGTARMFSLHFGGQFGYLLRGTTRSKGVLNQMVIDKKDILDLSNNNRIELSVIAGFSFSMNVLKSSVMNVEMRFQRSSNSINRKGTSIVYPRHHGFSIALTMHRKSGRASVREEQ